MERSLAGPGVILVKAGYLEHPWLVVDVLIQQWAKGHKGLRTATTRPYC